MDILKLKKKVIVFDNYQEHIAVALFTGVALDYFVLNLNIIDTAMFYPALLLGAIYPDIDITNSYIGSKVFLSGILSFFFGHRTITHSVFLMTLLFGIAAYIWGINAFLAGFTIGFITHILGDLTNGRVQILYPMSKKKFGKRLYGIEK